MPRKKTTTNTKKKTTTKKVEQPVEPIVETVAETVVEKTITVEEQALRDFVDLYNSLPNLITITDAQAREIHKYWQIISHRTDYYVHCGVCSLNHIKALKKLAKQKGYKLNK